MRLSDVLSSRQYEHPQTISKVSNLVTALEGVGDSATSRISAVNRKSRSTNSQHWELKDPLPHGILKPSQKIIRSLQIGCTVVVQLSLNINNSSRMPTAKALFNSRLKQKETGTNASLCNKFQIESFYRPQ